jgi:hypothetical protein
MKTILYFDIFKYPLTRTEVYENSAVHINREEFEPLLDQLIDAGYAKETGSYILSKTATEEDIIKREKGNAGARQIMPLAYKYARKIASYPFVAGVYFSGSISKNYFDEKSDIDFFIITKPGRLWICRTFIILKYKLLPQAKRRYWCPNYFITADNLCIPDQNSFTGTELAFLIPAVNYGLYKQLLDKNSWYKLRYPNKKIAADNSVPPPLFGLKLFEFLFAGRFGNLIDNLLLRFTLKRWRKKYPSLSEVNFELQFRTRKNVCKRHSLGFQNKVLLKWSEKTELFEKMNKVRVGTV